MGFKDGRRFRCSAVGRWPGLTLRPVGAWVLVIAVARNVGGAWVLGLAAGPMQATNNKSSRGKQRGYAWYPPERH